MEVHRASPLCLCLASGGPRAPRLGLESLLNLCLRLLLTASPCACLLSASLPFCKDTSPLGLRTHSTPPWPHHSQPTESAVILFPSKVACGGLGGQAFNQHSGGHNSPIIIFHNKLLNNYAATQRALCHVHKDLVWSQWHYTEWKKPASKVIDGRTPFTRRFQKD